MTTVDTPGLDDEPLTGTVEPTEVQVKKGIQAQPDWHLFHALQTTRSALVELDALAKTPPPTRNVNAELKAIETQVMGSVRGASIMPRVGDGRTPAASSPSVRFGPLAGIGRAPSTSIAASPLTTMWNAQ